jgi:hypothetical protein
MIDDRDLGRFAVRQAAEALRIVGCAGNFHVAGRRRTITGPNMQRNMWKTARSPTVSLPTALPLALRSSRLPMRLRRVQNVLGLLIAALLIAYNYVTAEPRRQD